MSESQTFTQAEVSLAPVIASDCSIEDIDLIVSDVLRRGAAITNGHWDRVNPDDIRDLLIEHICELRVEEGFSDGLTPDDWKARYGEGLEP